MDLHFTYNKPEQEKLKQGDILKKTPGLLELIKSVHPHYAGDDYLYFQVLTQSCDLVRRKGACKSRYITLAAVRALDLIVERAIDTFPDKVNFDEKTFCSTAHKKPLEDTFNKLLNNNDPHHFFLQAEPELGLMVPCCTHLHLSISIRAYEHFQVCLDSKILELSENFRAKLGWLVGNLYSRVGTEDYVPGAIPDAETYQNYVSDLMNNYVAWVPASDFAKFKQQSQRATSVDDIQLAITQDRERSRDSRLTSLVTSIAKPLQFDEAQKLLLRNILGQHPLIQKILS